MASKRTGYSKMYMVPPSVWELVKNCVDELELKRLENLNRDTTIQAERSLGENVISNISAQDIMPLDKSYRSRSSILEANLSQPPLFQEPRDEFYMSNPSFHQSDRSRSMLNPDHTNLSSQSSNFGDITVRSNRGDFTTQTIPMSEASTQILPMSESSSSSSRRSYGRNRADFTTQTIPMSEASTQILPMSDSSRSYSRNRADFTTQTIPMSEASTQILPMSDTSNISRRSSKMKRSSTVPSSLPYPLSSRIRKSRSVTINEPSGMYDDGTFHFSRDPSMSSIEMEQTPGMIRREDSMLHLPSSVNFNPTLTSTPIGPRRPFTRSQNVNVNPNPPMENFLPILPLPSCRVNRSPIKTRIRTGALPAATPKVDPFKCDICGKTFARKYNLNKHLVVIHKSNLQKSSFDKWKV